MTWAANIADPNVPKIPLVIISPRRVLTGWTYVSGNVWQADFSGARVTKMWRDFGVLEYDREAAYPPVSGFYQDEDAGKLYVAYGSAPGPDDATEAAVAGTPPGICMEVSLYVSTQPFFGPCDPLDSSSDNVEWVAGLRTAPEASAGDKTALYGFSPLTDSALEILDGDGWLMPFLYDYTFHIASVRAYVMADSDLEHAASAGNVREEYRGYCGQPTESADGLFHLECFDFLAALTGAAEPAARFSRTEFGLVDPAAIKQGAEWWIRRVRGMVDDHVPVGIDFSTSPSTSNNRKFATHEGTAGDGTIVQSVDTANGGNSGTRTYTVATPKVNIGDAVVIKKGGTDRYAFVTNVNRASKYFDHSAIAGSFTGGDNVTRYYIGWVKVKDENGTWWNIYAKRNFTMIDKSTESNNPDWLGFKLINNWEGDIGFPSTFDPSKHEIVCRVYGTASLDKYADAVTDVGAVADDGGVASNAISLLYWLLLEAGVPDDFIDQATFAAASTNHELGLAFPRAASDAELPTYKDLIQLVLQSMIWRLTYVGDSSGVRIGLKEAGPFGAADYTADDNDFRDVGIEHDYSELADTVALEYGAKESPRLGDYDVFLLASSTSVADGTQKVSATNYYARQVHLVRNEFTLEILQFLKAQAQVIADRYSFALGDRRAYFSLTFGADFLSKGDLGSTFNVSRQRMPGYSYEEGTERTRKLGVIESTKSARDVILTLEDQKGIEDNAGSW